MKLLCTILLGFLLSGCYLKKRTIMFINQSEYKIDSITIGISSADVYKIKHVNIEPSDTVISFISKNIPRSNKHDVMVEITIYIKNHDLIYRYYYDDLAGYLYTDFTIVLDRRKEVKWIVNPINRVY